MKRTDEGAAGAARTADTAGVAALPHCGTRAVPEGQIEGAARWEMAWHLRLDWCRIRRTISEFRRYLQCGTTQWKLLMRGLELSGHVPI